MIKSSVELDSMRKAGKAHDRALVSLLPDRIDAGMSEFEISRIIMDIFLSEGHIGALRLSSIGEDIFLGHTSVGDNANYPSVFNGPVGLKGVHASAPFMGSFDTVWKREQLLTVDNGFNVSGYHTDKTMIYWSGTPESIPDSVKRAHDFCLSVQARAALMLRPGTAPEEIWHDCMEQVEASPWKDGFMGYGRNKVSFLGHGIGLVIDEYPAIAPGFSEPLETGMTIALEPKIALPGVGMVGIENTFEVTEEGGRSLTGVDYDIICIC
jgi:Xaa-Pro dipeptidase